MNIRILGTIILAIITLAVILHKIYPSGLENPAEFQADIFKILLEIGLFGLLALLVKYLADEYTRRKLHRGEQLSGLLEKRLESYTGLWMITAFCNCKNQSEKCDEPQSENSPQPRCRKTTKKGDIYKDMRSWYFENGNGFYLSRRSKSIYDKIKELDKDEKISVNLLQKNNKMDRLLSELRSSLKYDCGVYNEKELNKKPELH